MSSSCILMQILPRIHFVLYVAILLQFTNSVMAKPYLESSPKELPGDFLDFVKNIGSVLYKHSENSNNRNKIIDNHKRQFRKNPDNDHEDPTLNSQKVALRDVLMMKLVSYYEDKYNVAQDVQNTDMVPLTSTTVTKAVIEDDTVFGTATAPYDDREEMPEVVIL